MITTPKARAGLLAIAAASALVLSACGDTFDDTSDDSPASTVVTSVPAPDLSGPAGDSNDDRDDDRDDHDVDLDDHDDDNDD